MIPTLKKVHEESLKKRLVEIHNNPQLLREFDEKQLDDMHKALKSFSKILSAPEFKPLTSFHLGLRKAYSNLNSLLSTNRLVRAVKVKSELKTIVAFTEGMSKLMRQLPQIIDIAKNSLLPEGEWDPNEPISQVYQKHAEYTKLKELRNNVIKAMKPSMFGNMPYINVDEAATELLDLSLNQIQKLEELLGRGRLMQQTVMNPGFSDQMLKMIGLASNAPSTPGADEQEGQPSETSKESPKLEMPPPSSPVAEKPAPQLPSLSILRQDIQTMFTQAYKKTYPEHQKIPKREDLLMHNLIDLFAGWMDKKSLLARKKKG